MPPAHETSSERRARRARRKKLRRNGKRLIYAGWVVVVVAGFVGAIGLSNALRSDDDVSTSSAIGASSTTMTRRDRPSATSTVVVDLVPTTDTTVVGGGGGGGTGRNRGNNAGSSSLQPLDDVLGDTFGVRGTLGVVEVRAAPRNDRPRPNLPPSVSVPAQVTRDANGNAVISGITIVDPDYPGSGDIGVALIGPGRITVTLNQDVQLLTRNSEAFVGLVGPPAALNRALADLRFQSREPVDLLITVTDWAYGDLSRSESGYASVRVL